MNAEERLKEYVERDEIYKEYKKDKLMNPSDFEIFCIQYCKDIEEILEENQELKKQLDYLRSEEYYNQLRFERDMLQNVVDNGEVPKEDKQFIDMTHRNTVSLEQQKEFIKWLEDYLNLFDEKDIYEEGSYDTIEEILQKYKSIIGDDK